MKENGNVTPLKKKEIIFKYVWCVNLILNDFTSNLYHLVKSRSHYRNFTLWVSPWGVHRHIEIVYKQT